MCIIFFFVFIFELWILCIFNVFCDGEVFWRATFGPLTLLTQKIKILKKWKNTRAYYHFTLVYHKWRSYDAWFLKYQAWPTEFFWHFVLFCPFTPLTTWKIKNEKKWLEISFYTWAPQVTIMRGSWDMEHDRQDFSHFGSFFALLPPNNPENQNFENMKRHIIILHKCTKNHDHILYCSLNIVCDGCNVYF